MMKSAGVSSTNVVTFNAFSPHTRQRLHEARKLSVGNCDKLSGTKNDDESSITSELRQNEPDISPIPVQTITTSDTDMKSPHKLISQQRSSSHSLILTAPSSRPSAAAQRLATKPPVDAAIEDNDGQDVQQKEDSTQSEVHTLHSIVNQYVVL